MTQIIDFHTHPYLTAEQDFYIYKETNLSGIDEYQSILKNAGITQICGSVIQRAETIPDFSFLRELNRNALELKDRFNVFYIPGFHIHPRFVKDSCDEIEFMHSKGIKLIGELVHYMHDWGEFDEKSFLEIMDVANSYEMICSYHTPFKYDMTKIIAANPKVKFVAAHPGEQNRVEEHIEIMKKYDNYYLDLSGTGLFRFGMLKHLVTRVGADRILFGTDYPICNPQMYVQAVYGERISDEDREKIFYKNAASMLL